MFNNFVGNEKALELVKTQILAAQKLNVKLPNMLFTGMAGVGKTFLSKQIANEMDATFKSVNATTFSSETVIISTIHDMICKHNESNTKNVILMIDEAHALPSKIEDLLLTIISENTIPIKEKGVVTEYKIVNKFGEDNDFFSFILATNRASELAPALRSRLTPVVFVNYSLDEKAQIAINHLSKLGLFAVPKAVYSIAERSWSAREVKQHCDNIHGFCVANNIEKITEQSANMFFDLIGIDEKGLNEQDRKYLMALKQCNGTASLNTISSILGLKSCEITEMIEPKMNSLGLIKISSSGRELVNYDKNPFAATR